MGLSFSAYGAEFLAGSGRLIIRTIRERLGPIRLQIEVVDHIERTERGKFRAVSSEVKREHADDTYSC